MGNKSLIVEPGGGLGNRILTLISAFNLARDCGIKNITVLWRNNNECGCEFEDVFSSLPLPCRTHTIHFGKESYKQLLSERRFMEIIRKFLHLFFYKIFRLVTKCVQIHTKQDNNSEEAWHKIKERVQKSKRKHFYIEAYYHFYGKIDCQGISFNREIEDKAADYKRQLGSYIAMHIRRTDNDIAIKNSPTLLFLDKADELITEDGNVKIYVATDDAEILKNLKAKYPSNIFSEAKNAASRRTSDGIQFALYEMLLLAGAETLYAGYGSTFSQIANLIGENEMVVLKKE